MFHCFQGFYFTVYSIKIRQAVAIFITFMARQRVQDLTQQDKLVFNDDIEDLLNRFNILGKISSVSFEKIEISTYDN